MFVLLREGSSMMAMTMTVAGAITTFERHSFRERSTAFTFL
jgi:hypothetical protein